MPIYSNLYSNLARQGLTKTFTHGYAQSVVAATHPASYPNQHHRAPFTRRPSRLGKLGSYQFQNAFHNSTSSTGIAVQDVRQERIVGHDSGLEAYFDAWKKQHAAGEPEKEWTQFQFVKRIEWKPISTVVELQGKEEEIDPFAQSSKQDRGLLGRSYSTSAIDELKSAHDVAESVAPGKATDVSEEDKSIASEYASAIFSRAPTPLVSSVRSAASTVDTHLLESSTATACATPDIQSQSYADHLKKLSSTRRYAEIPAVFEAMLVAAIRPTTEAYNALLAAAIHLPAERIQVVPKALDVYSDMLKRKVTPNSETYETLVNLLASRCIEVSSLKKSLEEKRVRFGGMEEPGKFIFASNEVEYAILSEDDRLDFAVKLFYTSLTVRKHISYSAETYHKLILACAESERIPDMVRIYKHMESRDVIPLATTFPPMIQCFTKTRDLINAVEYYNKYKTLAELHDHGRLSILDRQDATIYAAVVRAYVESDKMKGALSFYKKITSEYGPNDTNLQSLIIVEGFVEGLITLGDLDMALSWAGGVEPTCKAIVMSRIATAAADRGNQLVAASAFANIPWDFNDIVIPAMALLAVCIRQGDVAAALSYWQILSSPNMAVTSAFIEPTAMYAVALIGSGQISEGVSQADQMFQRIKDSVRVTQSSISDEVDEGIEFVQKFMAQRGIKDPRIVTEAPPDYPPNSYTSIRQRQYTAAPSEDLFDPYAASTDFRGSTAIAYSLGNGTIENPKVVRFDDALTKFYNIRRSGRHPRYLSYAMLITAAARECRMELVQDILEMAQKDIPLLSQYPIVRNGWICIINSMVSACLSLGDRELAAKYHQDLLDMGSAPSAQTYGIYITTLKDTYDEASEAVKIFNRAKSEGVALTPFLYNALIGKLAKARRIDECLFYFAEMRVAGLQPTSVTYGTIVNALCRVSDEKFAVEVFQEMESLPNYKPRAAPYNCMMQFFLHTHREKWKVLAYYDRMKGQKIKPTSHTYKLLIDAHATLEPINMTAAEAILDVIRSTGEMPEAVHYSSLIHAKGCVLHDVDGARAIFDAVLADISIGPQACLYQALIEAMVANHQIEETESLLEDMSLKGVKITGYIANPLIHGWAKAKKIEKSEAIYASLGHERREPSTYEAMARAYMLTGNKPGAEGVVQELFDQGYPKAVSGKLAELVGVWGWDKDI